MRLRRSRPYGPGIKRVRRGRGFSYVAADGTRLTDENALDRIRALVIPPAWRKVWICPYRNGHIQAVGVDAAGRRQYLYHEQWRNERDEEKFDRVLVMAANLPRLRSQVRADLTQSGLGQERITAAALRLLDRGVFRVGGEEYAEEHGTRGVATLLREQVTVSGNEMLFDYLAKGSIRRRVRIYDPELARVIRALQRSRSPSDRLLAYRNGNGYRELHADDINCRFKELAGTDCTAKDLRTWQATVLAAAAFGAEATDVEGIRNHKRVEKKVIAGVAEALGNTPAVARGSYIDPRVIEAYEAGETIAAALRRAQRADSDDDQQQIVDKAVVRLLRKRSRQQPKVINEKG
ncbi:DNA topoisomerase IB [Skermania sp. ID1734]|uniref:DNA topoisomerase IB n=1 Tax=Skermania sp. ID1734 TaxID=2597516 RepID=UPI00117CC687|nr:DNA topoisomerase IB [Skermania sp. ID1734]TSD99510.1 DNA topoisomerase IB [Skermania sp. ID1734]